MSPNNAVDPVYVVDDSIQEEKLKKRGFNPVKNITHGVAGGISHVEKGVSHVGKRLNKVPGVKHGVSFFNDYRNFLDRGNVIDLAVAVVIGAAFTAIVTSLVNDIITPLLAMTSGKNLEENFLILRRNEDSTESDWATRDQAKAAGNITWNWGNFIQTVLNFFIISACVFILVKVYQMARNSTTEETEKECDYCLKKIPMDAVRCSLCTTWLDWDACAKVKQMESAATGACTPYAATASISSSKAPTVDPSANNNGTFPNQFHPAQTSLGRF